MYFFLGRGRLGPDLVKQLRDHVLDRMVADVWQGRDQRKARQGRAILGELSDRLEDAGSNVHLRVDDDSRESKVRKRVEGCGMRKGPSRVQPVLLKMMTGRGGKKDVW